MRSRFLVALGLVVFVSITLGEDVHADLPVDIAQNASSIESREMLIETEAGAIPIDVLKSRKEAPSPPPFLRKRGLKKSPSPSNVPRLGKYFIVVSEDGVAGNPHQRCFHVKETENAKLEAFDKIDCKKKPDPLLKRVVEVRAS